MAEVPQETIVQLAHKTGLEVLAVENLLAKGWRYVEKLGEISRWEHPMWQLQDRSKIDSMYETLSKPIND